MGAALRLTKHGADRARQRIGRAPDLDRAVRLPKSAARRLESWRTPHAEPGKQLWCTGGSLLLVGRGGRVITVVPLVVEDLAAVLVWKLFGAWT